MTPSSPSGQRNIRPPHPLALRLIERLRGRHGIAVADIGTGSGRNARALDDAGFIVSAVSDRDAAALALPRGPFDAAIATHALLHGTPATIAALVSEIASTLRPGAPFHATFASTRDARYGEGERLGECTYAPTSGDEIGVAHSYFEEPAVRTMVSPFFIIDVLHEVDADTTAGSWAHQQQPLRGAAHWFLEARRLGDADDDSSR